MLDLYKNIKRRRESLGMSQDTLASLTGYTSRSSIAKIESGLVDLPQTKILLFAEALKTTPGNLMGWETNDDTTTKLTSSPNTDSEFPPDIRAAARGMMELDENDRKSAIDMINFLSKQGRDAKK